AAPSRHNRARGSRCRLRSVGLDRPAPRRAHVLDAGCAATGDREAESVPEGGDTYLLKWIVHDWDDTRAMTILRNCRRAMGPSSKVLLGEGVIPAGSA